MNNSVILSAAINCGDLLLKNSNLLLMDFAASRNDDVDLENIIFGLTRKIGPKLLKIEMYVEKVVASYNEVQFQQNFRMSREAFQFLLEIVSRKMESPEVRPGRKPIALEHQLLAVVWLLATPDSYRSISERFNMPKSTLSNCFFRIVKVLNDIADKIITWPSNVEKEESKNKIYKSCKIKNVIGCIDGTYVPIKAPKEQSRAYTNRKCFTGVTFQAIADANMVFIDCFVGYPSSVGDARIFKNSDIYEDVNLSPGDFFNGKEVILRDKAYPLTEWCIPPFINRGRLTPSQTYFNNIHAKARCVVERSFALFFGRLRRMRYLDMNRIECVPATILAACVIHNVCLKFPCGSIMAYIEEGQQYVHGNDNDIELHHNHNNDAGSNLRNEMEQFLWANRRIHFNL